MADSSLLEEPPSDDEGFVPVRDLSEDDSFVDLDRSSEESSTGRFCAQISVGSCVLLGNETSTRGTHKNARGESSESSISGQTIVVLDEDSVLSGLNATRDDSSSCTNVNEWEKDSESEASSVSAGTFYLDPVDIYSNSPRGLAVEDLIKAAADLMFVPQTAAKIILDHFDWDMNKLCESYIGNEEQVWSSCNVHDQCMAHRSRQTVEPNGQAEQILSSTRTARSSVIVCLGCGLENHAPITCEQFQKWSRKCADEEGSIRWILENTKKCPSCSHRIPTDVACEGAVTLPCEKCGFILHLFKGVREARVPGTKMDAPEWFINCLDEFNQHETYENKMKEVRQFSCFSAARGTSLDRKLVVGETHFLLAINQLIECHHVLKFCSAGLYFRGESPNGLIEHRRNLLVSLAEDLREATLGERIRQPGMIINKTAAVGRFVSSLLDDLELHCSSNLEPPCENMSTENMSTSDANVPPLLPKDRSNDGNVLWCLHPDCLESTDHFTDDAKLARHYAEAHDGDFGDESNHGATSSYQTSVTASAAAGAAEVDSAKPGAGSSKQPGHNKKHAGVQWDEIIEGLSNASHPNKKESAFPSSTTTSNTAPAPPTSSNIAPAPDLMQQTLLVFDGLDTSTNPSSLSQIRSEINGSVRLATKAAILETGFARRKLAQMGLPLRLEAYSALADAGGKLPPQLVKAVEKFAEADGVNLLRRKLRALKDTEGVARSKLSNLAGLVDDQESADRLFQESHPGFRGGGERKSVVGPLREELERLDEWLAQQHQAGIEAAVFLENSNQEPSLDLLQQTREELEQGMPGLEKARDAERVGKEVWGIDTTSLRSTLAELSQLIREREGLVKELQAKAATLMSNASTTLGTKHPSNDGGVETKAQGEVGTSGVPAPIPTDIAAAIDSKSKSSASQEGAAATPSHTFPQDNNGENGGSHQARLGAVVDAALHELLPTLPELADRNKRQSLLLKKVEAENALFCRALADPSSVDSTFRERMEYVRKIMAAVRTVDRAEKTAEEARNFYVLFFQWLDEARAEYEDAVNRMETERLDWLKEEFGVSGDVVAEQETERLDRTANEERAIVGGTSTWQEAEQLGQPKDGDLEGCFAQWEAIRQANENQQTEKEESSAEDSSSEDWVDVDEHHEDM